jgi:hypothetical protein
LIESLFYGAILLDDFSGENSSVECQVGRELTVAGVVTRSDVETTILDR